MKIKSTKPDKYTPKIVEKKDDYVHVEYESPILGVSLTSSLPNITNTTCRLAKLIPFSCSPVCGWCRVLVSTGEEFNRGVSISIADWKLWFWCQQKKNQGKVLINLLIFRKFSHKIINNTTNVFLTGIETGVRKERMGFWRNILKVLHAHSTDQEKTLYYLISLSQERLLITELTCGLAESQAF